MRSAIVACALLAVACGPSAPPASKVETPVAAGACPATWDEAIGGDSGDLCDHDGGDDCWYPEGSCYCGLPERCRPEGQIDDFGEPPQRGLRSWQCQWSATRPDGCPGEMPHETACAEEGQQCTYSFPCCNEDVNCRGGTWQRAEGGCGS